MALPPEVEPGLFRVLGVRLAIAPSVVEARVTRHIHALADRAALRLPWCFDHEPTPQSLLGEDF